MDESTAFRFRRIEEGERRIDLCDPLDGKEMSREFVLEVVAGMPTEARERFQLRIAVDAHSNALDVRFCATERTADITAPSLVESRYSGLTSGIAESCAGTLTAILALGKK